MANTPKGRKTLSRPGSPGPPRRKGRSSLAPSRRTPPRSSRNRARRRFRRLAVVYDIEGPRVRLGIGWGFLVLVGALAAGEYGLAAVYGAAAALAAYQTAQAWADRAPVPPNPYLCAVLALAFPASAAVNAEITGVVCLGAVVVALVSGAAAGANPLVGAGYVLRSSLVSGLAAAAVVIVWRVEPGGALFLVAMTFAYETGDYLIGSGARNPFEGPLGGIAGIVVVAFVVGVFGIGRADVNAAWRLGAMAIALAPVGQLVGSLILPSVTARAPALRRIDTLLVLGPMFAVAYQGFVRTL